MHFVDQDKMRTYNRGEIPEVIRNFELVTDHYNTGSINLALEVTERINRGEFTWEDDFKDVHPSPFGQHIYFRSMKAFLDHGYGVPLTGHEQITVHLIPGTIDPFCYDKGEIVPFTEASDMKGFELYPNWSPAGNFGTRKGYTGVDMLVGEHAGDCFTFHFEGRAVGIMVAAGPDAGMIAYSIDGAGVQKADLFTPWSQQLYLPWYLTLAAELDQGPHTLEVKISEDKNPDSAGHSCIIKAFYINK
jgi:sialidase-1